MTKKSDVVGVKLSKRSGKWYAWIYYDGKTRHIGVFSDCESATSARKEAEAKAADGSLAEWLSVMRKASAPPDLSGKAFGKLRVVRKTEKRTSKGEVIWLCECECGKNTEVATYDLSSGRTKSCGCSSEGLSNALIDGTSLYEISNRRPKKNSTTGVRGVSFNKKLGLYKAVVVFKGQRHYLGSFASLELAKAARLAGEKVFDDYLRQCSKDSPEVFMGFFARYVKLHPEDATALKRIAGAG
jgi:hypothetical protein